MNFYENFKNTIFYRIPPVATFNTQFLRLKPFNRLWYNAPVLFCILSESFCGDSSVNLLWLKYYLYFLDSPQTQFHDTYNDTSDGDDSWSDSEVIGIIFSFTHTTFTFSKSAMEIPEECVKSIQS